MPVLNSLTELLLWLCSGGDLNPAIVVGIGAVVVAGAFFYLNSIY